MYPPLPQGMMGMITNGLLPRADCYQQGVLFAFAPFISDAKFWDSEESKNDKDAEHLLLILENEELRKKLHKLEQERDAKLQCEICYKEKVSKLLLPCTHTLCATCAQNFYEKNRPCPMCQRKIDKIQCLN